METVTDFIFLGSKITADGDCSLEIKRRLLLGRKAMTNLDCILKSRDITLPAQVHLVKAMVFPVAMYGYEPTRPRSPWRIPGTEEPGGLPEVYGVAQSRTRLKQLSSSSS